MVLAGFIRFNSAYFFLVGCWLCKIVFTLDCSGSLWITLDDSGLVWILAARQRQPYRENWKRESNDCPERGQFGVQCRDEEMAYPPPPVPAVPPSQTNDCKGFLRFKPSQRRPKSSSSRPKGCGGVLLRVLSVRSAVEGGQFVRTVAAVRREA